LCWGCGWRWSFRAIRRRRGEARQLAEKWFVQPDLQYIFHPGGNIPNPANPATVIPNALVLGTRMVMRF
jgi:carbohydrate-selective porin OprB